MTQYINFFLKEYHSPDIRVLPVFLTLAALHPELCEIFYYFTILMTEYTQEKSNY